MTGWERVDLNVLTAYGAYLDDQGYAYATEYIELTTVKQAINYLIKQKLLPAGCSFDLRLSKVETTTSFCYTTEQVQAMLECCGHGSDLRWLRDVMVALIHTGLRISELAALRWTDIQDGFIRIADHSRFGSKSERAARKTRAAATVRFLSTESYRTCWQRSRLIPMAASSTGRSGEPSNPIPFEQS